jgi:hypothetical protein
VPHVVARGPWYVGERGVKMTFLLGCWFGLEAGQRRRHGYGIAWNGGEGKDCRLLKLLLRSFTGQMKQGPLPSEKTLERARAQLLRSDARPDTPRATFDGTVPFLFVCFSSVFVRQTSLSTVA